MFQENLQIRLRARIGEETQKIGEKQKKIKIYIFFYSFDALHSK